MPDPYNRPLDDRTRKSATFSEPAQVFERQAQLSPGTVINNTYKVLSFIGAGGMSDVYKCEDLSIGRIVAVKTLQAGFSQDALRRFQTEGKAIAKLEHPNILRLYGLQSTPGGLPILIMEFVPGVTLARLLERREAFPVQRALRLGSQIGEALKAAEKEGIIHRDLKPSNIMIVNPGSIDEAVKILDFGIAKIQSDVPTDATRTGEVFGTPQYMSPEQAMGKKCDARSDQYSFGCVLFEMLTGAPPYTADNSLSVMMAHVQDPVPSLANSAKSRMPPHIHVVMTKLLQKNPAQRYATMEDALEALFNARKTSPISKKLIIVGLTTALAGAILTTAYCYYQTIAEKHSLESVKAVATIPANATVEEVIKPKALSQPTAFDNSLKANFNALKNQVTLNLNAKDVSNAGLETISHLANLQNLYLQSCKNVDSKGVAALGHLKLIQLNLSGTGVNDDIAESLMHMPDLEELGLDRTVVTTKLCEKISISRKLKKLELEETYIDDHAIPYIANISSLAILNISGDKIEGSLSELKRLHLTTLKLKCLTLTPANINILASMTTLRQIFLTYTNVTDQNLIELSRLPDLEVLNIEGCKNITLAGVMRFHQKAPKCHIQRTKFPEEFTSPNSSTASDTILAADAVGENLIHNGSFEDGGTIFQSHIYKEGEKNIPEWQIVSGSVKLIRHDSNPEGGPIALELNDKGGAIRQTVATEPGAPYQVMFQCTSNQKPGSNNLDQIMVTVNNQTKTFDIENPENVKKIQWHRCEWLFVASSNRTTIEFASNTPGSRGPWIDNISVKRKKSKPKASTKISPLLEE
jgi:serine/threonine protein kinase